MIYLALKTDSEGTELYLLKDGSVLDRSLWQSGRNLASQLPTKIKDLLVKNEVLKVDGYIGYLGPGSFTGLRIGLSAINALAYIDNCPIVGSSGEEWIKNGIARLDGGYNDKVLLPSYGAEPYITAQKK